MNITGLELTQSRTGFPHPTEEQLTKINRYTPSQTKPLESHEVVVVTYTVADNLLNRSSGVWDTETLQDLALLLPGLPFTLDHDWTETTKEQGKIFDSRVIHHENSVTDSFPLNRAGNFSKNSAIVSRHGLVSVEADVYFSSDSPFLERLRKGLHSNVSLGGFRVKDYVCPLCNESFFDENCYHTIPYPGEPEDETVAPYHIRKGILDAGELSAVLIPNLPNAKIK